MYPLQPGYATYGHTVGIIMQDDGLIRFPGDVGNLDTYSFPVTYGFVEDFPMEAMATPELVNHADKFIRVAQELVRRGCSALGAGCGFTALIQPLVAASVEVPVAMSALVQVPLIHALLPPNRKVGIITANAHRMTEAHFNAVGWSSRDIPVAVVGVDEDATHVREDLGLGRKAGDERAFDAAQSVMVRLAMGLVEREPAVGGIVFECTNMPPFAAAVQAATRLPVFDIVTLITMLHGGVTQAGYGRPSWATAPPGNLASAKTTADEGRLRSAGGSSCR